MPDPDDPSVLASPRRGSRLTLACVSLAVAGVVAWQSIMALLVFLVDGVAALAVLSAAALGGLWVVRALVREPLPLRWHLLLGAGLGIGALSLLMLCLGLLGCLSAPVWYAILVAGGIAGLVRLARLLQSASAGPACTAGRWRWLWLAVVPFAALAILAASVPPGLLWAEEGNGFDVLEYHLQLPREYLQAGRITYVPHNVYANFPANAEMLYLVCMVLKGDPIQATAMAKMVNLALAGLIVAAAWLIGRERSPVAGVVTGVVTAGTGWLTYLSGIAYVENAMLLFGLLQMAVLARLVPSGGTECEGRSWSSRSSAEPGDSRARSTGRFDSSSSHFLRWMVVAGLLGGLACGCKYTGAVLVALPLAIVVIGVPSLPLRTRLVGLAAYGMAAVLSFAPWLLKNGFMTGDPVFPLSGGLFDNHPAGWGEREARHFAECHRLGPDERSFGSRVALLWRYVPADADQRVGPLLILLAIAGLVITRPTRIGWLCALVLAAQVLVWMFATHLYARFAVPFLIPLIVLAAGAACRTGGRWGRVALPALILAGLLFNAFFAGRLYARHLYSDGQRLSIEGAPDVFAQGKFRGYEFYGAVNNNLPDEANVLLVGEARVFYFQRDVDYCVVFNRNPFIEAVRAAGSASDVLDWLRARGYTHVLINWREIGRLRRSRYGCPDEINPELAARLTAAGLLPVHAVMDPVDGVPYATLFSL
ncbi:MAG: hypothetical protein JSV19_06470 [Phycisphaerales bacterium]|nr:MAG: hypothetical protein JSV19_06470 [Phycisphaerales bacterium]